MSTEVFNPSKVKAVMSDIASEFDALSKLIETTNTLVTTALGSPDKAVYGDAGNKILATWDENCSTLSSFIKIYDNWSLMAVSIAREYGELDKGTAKVKDADAEALKTVADNNRTTWLKTPEGSKGYVGSTNSYINAASGTRVTEKSDLKNMRVVDRGNGLTEYYSLDGKLLGIKRNGQYYDANGRKIDSKDLRYKAISDDKLKKSQVALKSSINTKHSELKERDKKREEAAAASEWAIGPYDSILHMNQHEANSGDKERQRRIAFLGGMKGSDAEQRAMMTNIKVPVWDGTKETTITLFVNKKLVNNYQKAFREVCDLRFPIKVNPSQSANCAYAWNHYRPGGERSDHAYGGTFDINTADNFGTGKNNQYSLRNRPDVVKAFEKQGFFWGGNWESGKDDMHFSFTGY